MAILAKGHTSAVITGMGRRDEVGEMAQAVGVFKDHMQAEQRLSAEQEAERVQTAEEKRAALVGMAETIERETATALSQIGDRADAMTQTAEQMSASAQRTGTASGNAASAAARALANAQTVASAAEELSASMRRCKWVCGARWRLRVSGRACHLPFVRSTRVAMPTVPFC